MRIMGTRGGLILLYFMPPLILIVYTTMLTSGGGGGSSLSPVTSPNPSSTFIELVLIEADTHLKKDLIVALSAVSS